MQLEIIAVGDVSQQEKKSYYKHLVEDIWLSLLLYTQGQCTL